MPINLPNKVIRPAVEFDTEFAIGIHIRGNIVEVDGVPKAGQDFKAAIELIHMSSVTKEVDPLAKEQLVVESVRNRILANPTGKMAQLHALIVEVIAEERDLQRQEKAAAEEAARLAAEQEIKNHESV